MTVNSKILEARNVSVTLGGRGVLHNVDLALDHGTLTAIAGANGAGKSTLLRVLNRTLTPDSGEVIAAARPIRDLSRLQIARLIAVVAQENETKFPVTVRDFVLGGRFAYGSTFGWETEADNAAAERAIEVCDIAGAAGRLMNELSGGERQRVLLARALAAETEVLLLDEPTANVDILHQALLMRTVRRQCVERGIAAALITHDLNIAAEFADVLMLLRDGAVFACGRPHEVLTAENIAAVFAVRSVVDANPSSGRRRVTVLF